MFSHQFHFVEDIALLRKEFTVDVVFACDLPGCWFCMLPVGGAFWGPAEDAHGIGNASINGYFCKPEW